MFLLEIPTQELLCKQLGEQDSRSLVTLQCLVSCAAIKMSR